MASLAEQTWRLFIAIELPPDIPAAVMNHIRILRRDFPDASASWTRAENLHLTLKFLGDTPVAKAESVSQALGRAARTIPPFDLLIGNTGAFPPRGKPGVLWIGIEDPTTQLHKLYEAVENELSVAGFPREQRSYHPHLTIARLRSQHVAGELAAGHAQTNFSPIKVTAKEVCLIRSELRSEGARHTTISRHRLGE